MSESVWKLMKENTLKILSEISLELKCSICKDIMIKACSAPCGCRFCSDCIMNYLNGNEKLCQGKSKYCSKKMINYANDIVIDYAINNQISEVIVKCLMDNCLVEVELNMLENHMKMCPKRPMSCPFYEIGCENNRVENNEIKYHLDEANYFHSKLLIDFLQNLHNEIESMKNEIIVLKRESNRNLDVITLQSINQQKIVGDIETKERANTRVTGELNQQIVSLKNDIETLKRDIEAKVELLKNDIYQTIKTIQEKLQHIDELKQNFQQNNDENKEFEMMKTIYEMSQENIDFRNDETNKRINNLEIKIIEIETEIENEKSFGVFRRKIENLSLRNKSAHIFSEPFYLGKSGYKMCLSAYIRIDNIIDVYFHLMRGEFDEKLKWPFKYSVKIDVIDQQNGNIFQSKTIKYSERPNHAGWGKIAGATNEIWFLSVPLNSPGVKDDKMVIKCGLKREI